MTAHWLLKTEPNEWSWDHQDAGGGVSEWDGVRSLLAQKHMKTMAVGDLCFFYHTGKERAVVGVVVVIKPWHPENGAKEILAKAGEGIVKVSEEAQEAGTQKQVENFSDADNEDDAENQERKNKRGKRKLSASKGRRQGGTKEKKATKEKQWGQVHVRAVRKLPLPVALAKIREESERDGAMADYLLLRQTRLSIVPTPLAVWRQICGMGGLTESEQLQLQNEAMATATATAGNGAAAEEASVEKVGDDAEADQVLDGLTEGSHGRQNCRGEVEDGVGANQGSASGDASVPFSAGESKKTRTRRCWAKKAAPTSMAARGVKDKCALPSSS